MMLRRFAIVFVCLLPGGAVAAQDLARWLAKLSVHGYVAQAYAVSDSQQILGIPPEGTTEYRDVALQFRYDANRRNRLVAQLRHERLGDTEHRSDAVELDWAFYQRDFSDRVSLKAGRIPLPLGIFNEAGGAVATSPFFRPPTELYERQYTSQTLEGVLTSVSLGNQAGWSFDVDAYGGTWALDQWDGERPDARNAYGAQVWVNTPWHGVRAGGGAYRCTVTPPGGAAADYRMVHASIEADFDRLIVASEYLTGDLDTFGRYDAWYAQVGVRPTSRLGIHVRRARARMDVAGNSFLPNAKISDDLGVAINYAIRPAVLLKLEGHNNVGLLAEDDEPPDLYDSPSKTRYLIVSVVLGF